MTARQIAMGIGLSVATTLLVQFVIMPRLPKPPAPGSKSTIEV